MDIETVLRRGLDLATALACAKAVYRHEFDPALGIKALRYFGDVPELPKATTDFLADAAAKVCEIPEVKAAATKITPDCFRKTQQP